MAAAVGIQSIGDCALVEENVPRVKKRNKKSPTPNPERVTPCRKSRSQTPFNVYLTRRSEDSNEPVKWRSITPFINREDKERTPFELGKDIRAQLISHKMVFDKASVMDVSETDFEPVRYITSDISVVDRAAVMDISNVEVIYMVEEYEEEEIPEELVQSDDVKKKKPIRKGRKGKSVDKEDASISDGNVKKNVPKSKKKGEKKKKSDSKSRSPSVTPPPKLTLKLELGGGPKMNKKMFERKQDVAATAKPPPKKSKLAMQMEEQAKEAAKTAAAAIRRESARSENKTDDAKEEEMSDEEEPEDTGTDEDEDEELDVSDEEQNETPPISPIPADDSIEENIVSASESSPTPEPTPIIKEKTRSPSPGLLPPKPASFWKSVASTEGAEFMEKMKFYNSVQHEKPHYPAFVIRLKDKCATEGETIRLVCAVSGPDLQIKWFKDDQPMVRFDHHERYNFIENDDIVSLEIFDSSPADTADYKCTISNKYEKVSCTSYVNVCEMQRYEDDPCPPTIVYFENSYHFMDDKLIIECQIQGIPRPTVKWTKDSNEIVHSKEHSLLEGAHGSYKIVIYHPSPKDNGIYSVNAMNCRGQQERKYCFEFLKTRTYSRIQL